MAEPSPSPSRLYSCSKTFSGFPCTHRQWRHPGHCRFVHGYSRSFTVWFRAHSLDEHGFVVDFSSLTELRERLRRQFDHTFLVNADDPLLATWQQLHDQGALDLRVMENVGMEASARLVWEWANALLQRREGGRSCCFRVEARENDANAARFEALPGWFQRGSAHDGPPEQLGASLPVLVAGLDAEEPWDAP